MTKKIAIFLIAVLLLSIFSVTASAKTVVVKATPTPTPTATPVEEVNSFDLFWPMVAGKTMQSKLYFLKTLKESVRGFFIFGSAQKADYDIFLGIKRVLESEVLIQGNVSDLANKTLDSASSDFDKAKSNLENAKNSGDIDQDTKNEINNRVSNLKKFVNFLKIKYPSYNAKLQTILDKLNSITV